MKKKFIPLICLFVSPLSLADWSIGLDYTVLKDDYILSDEFSSNILLLQGGYHYPINEQFYVSTQSSILLHSDSEQGIFSFSDFESDIDEIKLDSFFSQDIRMGFNVTQSFSVYGGLVYADVSLLFSGAGSLISKREESAIDILFGLEWNPINKVFFDASFSDTGDLGSVLKFGIKYRL